MEVVIAMTLARSLFRFTALRPVQKPQEATEEVRFLRPRGRRTPDGPAPVTALQEAIASAGSLADARALARTHILSPAYVRGFDDPDPLIGYLAEVYRAAVEAVRDGDGRRRFDAAVAALPDGVKDDALDRVHDRVWDSLISAFLTPTVLPHDRAEQVHLLQARRILEDVAEGDFSVERVREILRATPAVPGWAVPAEPEPEPGEHDRAGAGAPATDDEPATEELAEQLADVGRAAAEVRRSYRLTARERESRGTSRATGDAAGVAARRGPTDEATGLWTVSDRSEPPWRSAELLAAQLPEPAAALLDSLDPGWRLGTPDDVLALLARHERELHGRLLRSAAKETAAQEEVAVVDTPFTNPIEGSVGEVRPIGIGDLLVVSDTLLSYQDGELAYVENVMRTENRERVHRRLDRQVETVVTTTEQTTETERDLQSTDRYELATEVSQTVTNDVAISTGVNIAASYGPMLSVDTSAEFAVENSTETSSVTASTFAQEVVDTSVSRLSQTIKEQITTRTLSETEETNTHGFDNREGTEHSIGVYRWLDQLWQAQVLNYGKRLMMEFRIPEPAAYYRVARDSSAADGISLEPPEPLNEGFSFLDVTPGRYDTWVDRYRVPDVDPPPAKFVVSAKVIDIPEKVHPREAGDYTLVTMTDSMAVPDGYLAKEAWVYGTWTGWGDPYTLHVHVGPRIFEKENNDDYGTLSAEVGALPIGIYAFQIAAAVISIEIRCERSDELLVAWQLATYQKIVDTVAAQQAAYDAQVASVTNASAGFLNDLPGDKKREIEREEIKKGALVLLTDQHFADFGAVAQEAQPHGYPEIRPKAALEQGSYVEFLEQMLEWEQLTYFCYPYFWGRKERWLENSTVTDSDALFETFLRAGFVRAVVPVRRHFEKALAYYLTFGEIWGGGETPILDDKLYVSIVDELAESQDTSLDDAVPYGDPWTYTLPTALVKLQDDATLPTFEPPG